ncbi:MAG: hypothetical protein MUC83_12290 [Pirellula sp.]|jgi:hypothetical protein|nr:hypothetical protein [Pirellula sp.]
MRIAIAIMLICIDFAPGVAQEQEAPQSLAGFLKTGTHIGVVSFEDSDRIVINIYTERDHAIAIDSRNLSLDKLAAKYETVATRLEQTRKDYIKSLQSRVKDLPPGKEYGQPRIGLQLNPRESFHKITAIGDDYILVTSSLAPTKRRVFATRFISSIHWRDELEFNASVEQVDKSTDREKR